MKHWFIFVSSSWVPTQRTALFLLLIGAVFACVTPYQPDTKSLPDKLLIVDGYITDLPGPHQVMLSYTANFTNASTNYRVSGATVYVTDSAGKRQDFLEVGYRTGVYRTSADFQGTRGNTYQLNIVLTDGRRYVSGFETIKPVSPIDRVYDEYTQKLIPGTLVFDKGFNVYIDTKDPATPVDYYRWRWTHHELVKFCAIKSVRGADNPTLNKEYSYGCCEQCWDIETCSGPNCLNAFSDEAINGNAISRQFILRAPYDEYIRYYLEIEQLSISRSAYAYYKATENLTASNGGIFDVAPAKLQGNIRSLDNPDEYVLGYFSASGAQKIPYFVLRNNRSPLPPDLRYYPPTPPFYAECFPCVESDYRTRIKPRWWDL
ncbi:DUF4249 domain-containing protein [Fibrella aquatilis]|uniref:DUF4249 domain-containing protein n=1 Tax=Fibrella aquatilis TaxID=2817059 RepID=A0A939G6M6_9BACT|nr:DUF4249 domain-containing protein [Fibrella aquatilis]MBO0931589.1 DUF4249 domain-containing protein [Fibrella aquatilis]